MSPGGGGPAGRPHRGPVACVVGGVAGLVCNLQNHYADGMHQELTVT
jgi:hypothetical protein